MAIFNLGSINIDLVYRVSHFPAAGETLTTSSFMRALGGKGANQSIAAAAAGAKIFHIGAANPDDDWLLATIRRWNNKFGFTGAKPYNFNKSIESQLDCIKCIAVVWKSFSQC